MESRQLQGAHCNPLQFNVVNLLKIDSAYQAEINSSSYLAYSYQDVMILGGRYSFIFNNQKINKSNDFWFMRLNAEASGNLLGLIKSISGAPKTEDGTYEFLRQPFAQYIRTDIDVRYNYKFNNIASMVYRGFFGIGIPYGNSKAIPFEKQYFSGGANGIRAWQVRTLGPGSYASKDTATFINQTADIKLEAMPSTVSSYSGYLKEPFSLMQEISGHTRMIRPVPVHSSG